MMLENSRDALKEAILLRMQTLTIIGSLATAVVGIAASLNFEKLNTCWLTYSIILLTLTSIISLARYIWITRRDIKKLAEKIQKIPDLDLSKPIPKKQIPNDYWVEILFIFFIIGIVLFSLSILDHGLYGAQQRVTGSPKWHNIYFQTDKTWP